MAWAIAAISLMLSLEGARHALMLRRSLRGQAIASHQSIPRLAVGTLAGIPSQIAIVAWLFIHGTWYWALVLIVTALFLPSLFLARHRNPEMLLGAALFLDLAALAGAVCLWTFFA